jgi:hypothetical protein
MFCPRCAAQNLDDAKFCRVCGTNLETVALALADKYVPASKDGDKVQDLFEQYLETRTTGVNKVVKGIGLFLSSLLIGVALGLFSNTGDWIIIWVGLVGWMACWGIISIVTGTAALMESRFLQRQLAPPAGSTAALVQPLPVGDRLMMNECIDNTYPASSNQRHRYNHPAD